MCMFVSEEKGEGTIDQTSEEEGGEGGEVSIFGRFFQWL